MGKESQSLGLGLGADWQNFFGGGGLKEQQDLLDKEEALYTGIKDPTQQQLYGGDLAYQQLGPSQREAVDPRYIGAAQDALASFQDIASQGGLNAIDRANLDAIRAEEMQTQRAIGDTQRRDMARGGGGTAQLQALLDSQKGADRAATRNLGVASEALQSRRSALSSAGQLGMGLDQQTFAQNDAKERARAEAERFNAQNRANTDLSNIQRLSGAYQDQFGNSMAKAKGLGGVYRQKGQFAGDRNQAALGLWSDMADAGMRLGKGIATGGASEGLAGLGADYTKKKTV
jgi:hypothetical protein